MTTSYSHTVIGSKGFIGSRLLESLRKAGHNVYAPERGKDDWRNDHLGQVFYCAGLTADYASRPFDTVEAHVCLLSKILEHDNFNHLIYLSSTRLYDQLPTGLSQESVSLPLQPTNPRHLYDLSKALGENLCLTVRGNRTAIARLSCVYDWTAGAPGYLSEILQRAAIEKSFTLNTDSGLVRDYIHLDDVVAGLEAIMAAQATGVFNLASGENISNLALSRIFNDKGWHIDIQRSSPEQIATVCEIERLVSLGIYPRKIQEVVDTYLSTLDAKENK